MKPGQALKPLTPFDEALAHPSMADDVFGIVGTTQAGSFRVDGAVAEGGFAVVYRAYHIGFRARVALKCLKLPGSGTREEQRQFLTSFREEGELLFHLSAALPNVVRPLQVGMIDSKVKHFVPFIALEWLQGKALDVLIRDRVEAGVRPMSLLEAVELLTPVAETLEQAHHFAAPQRDKKVCIVHRDIKPENIFVAEVHDQRVVKILDFGIAKVKSAANQVIGKRVDRHEMPAFTAAYGAPEQWLPEQYGQTGPWTDVWGLALTLVEIVLGRCPIQGEPEAMLKRITDPESRPTPQNEGAAISVAAEAVFRKALAIDPRDRFASVRAFWEALTAAAHSAAAPSVANDGSFAPIPSLLAPPNSDRARMAPGTPAAPSVSGERRRLSEADVLLGHTIKGLGGSILPVAKTLALDELHGIGARPHGVWAHGGAQRRPTKVESRHGSKDFAGPITLLTLGVAMLIADWLYTRLSGDAFQLGPVRTLWVAGPLALIGLMQLLVRIVGDD